MNAGNALVGLTRSIRDHRSSRVSRLVGMLACTTGPAVQCRPCSDRGARSVRSVEFFFSPKLSSSVRVEKKLELSMLNGGQFSYLFIYFLALCCRTNKCAAESEPVVHKSV